MALKLEISASMGGDGLRGLQEMEKKLQDISRLTQSGMNSGFGKIAADLQKVSDTAKALGSIQGPFQGLMNMFSETGRRQNELFGDAQVRNMQRYEKALEDIGRRKETLVRRQEQLTRMMADPNYVGNKDRLASAIDESTSEMASLSRAGFGARMSQIANYRVAPKLGGGVSMAGMYGAAGTGLAIGGAAAVVADAITGYDARKDAAMSSYYKDLGQNAKAGNIAQMVTSMTGTGITGKIQNNEFMPRYAALGSQVISGLGGLLSGNLGGFTGIFSEEERAKYALNYGGKLDNAQLDSYLNTGGQFFMRRGQALEQSQKSFGARAMDRSLKGLQGGTGLTMDQLAPIMNEASTYNLNLNGQGGSVAYAKLERDHGFTQQARGNLLRMGVTTGLSGSTESMLGLQATALYGSGGYKTGQAQANFGMMQQTSDYIAGQQQGTHGAFMGLAAAQQARLAGGNMFADEGATPESLRVGSQMAKIDIGAAPQGQKEAVQLASLAKLGITGMAAMTLVNMGLESDSAKELLIQRVIGMGRAKDRDEAISVIQNTVGVAIQNFDVSRGKRLSGGEMLPMIKDALKAQGARGEKVLEMGDDAIMGAFGATGGNLKDMPTLMGLAESRSKGGLFAKDQMPTGTAISANLGPTAAMSDGDTIRAGQAQEESAIQTAVNQIPNTIMNAILQGFQATITAIKVSQASDTAMTIQAKEEINNTKDRTPGAKQK